MDRQRAIIIGAGPAGLTAAYELLTRTNLIPVIYETESEVGGISKTINFKGNRMDIGPHRFFSKSDRVMDWWLEFLPLQEPGKDHPGDREMIVCSRLTRIYFLRKFFEYPLNLNFETLSNLGLVRMIRIGLSFLSVRLFPIRTETSLEDFFINRFGRELYRTFFKDYTEKVWGVPCREIKPEWGAQRVKGLSISKAVLHSLKAIWKGKSSIEQKDVETSLIEQFLYPKHGAGQMWEEVAKEIIRKGGEIHLRNTVVGIESDRGRIVSVLVRDNEKGTERREEGSYFFSSMPVKDLVRSFDEAPVDVKEISEGLLYRDLISVGLVLKELKIKNEKAIETVGCVIPDNWIYIQENDVKIGRVQIFNNWGPHMVKDPSTVFLGCEYFCQEGDELWRKTDEEMAAKAVEELCRLGILESSKVLDHITLRMRKAYPGYFGTYDQFQHARDYLDGFENLFLIGRNGMHRYNNQDHSMLSAMVAVDNIVNGISSKENVWQVNAEEEYHEEK